VWSWALQNKQHTLHLVSWLSVVRTVVAFYDLLSLRAIKYTLLILYRLIHVYLYTCSRSGLQKCENIFLNCFTLVSISHVIGSEGT